MTLLERIKNALLWLVGLAVIFIVLPVLFLVRSGYRVPLLESADLTQKEKKYAECFLAFKNRRFKSLKEVVNLHGMPRWEFTSTVETYQRCLPEANQYEIKRRLCLSNTSECGYLNSAIRFNSELYEIEGLMAEENFNMPMKMYESESTFKGYKCTVDCSGHKGGYSWADENYIYYESDCPIDRGNSFFEGCLAYVEGK